MKNVILHGIKKQLEEIMDSCIDVQRRANSVLQTLNALEQKTSQIELPFDFEPIIVTDERGKKTLG